MAPMTRNVPLVLVAAIERQGNRTRRECCISFLACMFQLGCTTSEATPTSVPDRPRAPTPTRYVTPDPANNMATVQADALGTRQANQTLVASGATSFGSSTMA